MRSLVLIFLISFCASLMAPAFVSAQPPHIKKMLEARKRGIPAAPVVVAKVRESNIQGHTWYSGALVSRNEATLSSENDGRIIKIAEVGDRFDEGDVIMQLNPVLLQNALTEARSDIKRHQAQIQYLARQVKRLAILVEQNNVSESEYDETQSQLNAERAMLEAAKAREAAAQERFDRLQIRAPFDGVITQRHADRGEWIKAGDDALTFVELDAMEVSTFITATEIPFVKAGSTLKITPDALNQNELYTGRIRTIVPVGDSQSRLFELRLTAPEGLGLIGQSVRVAVPNSEPHRGLLIPEDALVIRGAGITVFTVDTSMTTVRVPVQIGRSQGDQIEVTGPLKEGDQVVIRGGERLREGMKVRTVNAP